MFLSISGLIHSTLFKMEHGTFFKAGLKKKKIYVDGPFVAPEPPMTNVKGKLSQVHTR